MPKQIPYPTDPVLIILSDGVERHLRYTLGALRRLKGKLGDSLTGGSFVNLNDDQLPELIAEGLIEGDLTAEQVADLIDARALAYVGERFMEAFGVDKSTMRPMTAAAETAVAESIGASSGPSADAISV